MHGACGAAYRCATHRQSKYLKRGGGGVGRRERGGGSGLSPHRLVSLRQRTLGTVYKTSAPQLSPADLPRPVEPQCQVTLYLCACDRPRVLGPTSLDTWRDPGKGTLTLLDCRVPVLGIVCVVITKQRYRSPACKVGSERNFPFGCEPVITFCHVSIMSRVLESES